MSDDTPKLAIASDDPTQKLDRMAAKLSRSLPRTADVSIANPDDLELKVISVDKLHNYERFREEATVYLNIIWMLIGAIIGTITSIIAEGIHDPSHLIFKLLAGQAIFTIFLIVMYRRFKRTADDARKILGL